MKTALELAMEREGYTTPDKWEDERRQRIRRQRRQLAEDLRRGETREKKRAR